MKPTKQQKVMETIIRNATQMWCADPIHLRNPLQFLQLCSHCVIDSYVEGALLRISSEQPCIMASTTSTIDNVANSQGTILLAKPTTPRKHRTVQVISKDAQKCSANEILTNVAVQQAADKQSDTTPTTEMNGSIKRSDPPPLAFYPKTNGKIQKPIIISATQPPPLIPIDRSFR